MRKIKLTTPENIEVEYILADLGSRTAAVIIDTLIQGLIYALLAAALLIIAYYRPFFWGNYQDWITAISLILFFLISYGYYIIMEMTMNGRTLGKKALKLRTIRDNGRPITLKHSVIRNLFRIIIDNFALGPLFIFFNKKHKRPGDYAASTIVVREQQENQPVILETLENIDVKLSRETKNKLTVEEYNLLCDFLERKDSLKDDGFLKYQLNRYFSSKFSETEVPDDLQKILSNL